MHLPENASAHPPAIHSKAVGEMDFAAAALTSPYREIAWVITRYAIFQARAPTHSR